MTIEDYLGQERIGILLAELPTKIKGFCTKGANGETVIVINSRLSDQAQRAAVTHELGHIMGDHLYCECSQISECETEAKAMKRIFI